MYFALLSVESELLQPVVRLSVSAAQIIARKSLQSFMLLLVFYHTNLPIFPDTLTVGQIKKAVLFKELLFL